jgi:glycosyltransferase involved in cell wall biosynthesis
VETFAPRDVVALAAAMTRALVSPGPRDAARRFAVTLTWDRCAQRTADIYREVLRECPKR